MILKYIYTLFVGILLALFVGVGIAAFYPQPKQPEYPASLGFAPPTEYPKGATPSSQTSSQFQAEQENFDRAQKIYQESQQQYQRTVSIIALSAAIIFLILSLTLLRNFLVITDGILLGGVFTLIYSIIRGFQTTDTLFRFLVISIGLAAALTLGYSKFIKYGNS